MTMLSKGEGVVHGGRICNFVNICNMMMNKEPAVDIKYNALDWTKWC